MVNNMIQTDKWVVRYWILHAVITICLVIVLTFIFETYAATGPNDGTGIILGVMIGGVISYAIALAVDSCYELLIKGTVPVEHLDAIHADIIKREPMTLASLFCEQRDKHWHYNSPDPMKWARHESGDIQLKMEVFIKNEDYTTEQFEENISKFFTLESTKAD